MNQPDQHLSRPLTTAEEQKLSDAIASQAMEGHHPTAGEVEAMRRLIVGDVDMAGYVAEATRAANQSPA